MLWEEWARLWEELAKPRAQSATLREESARPRAQPATLWEESASPRAQSARLCEESARPTRVGRSPPRGREVMLRGRGALSDVCPRRISIAGGPRVPRGEVPRVGGWD